MLTRVFCHSDYKGNQKEIVEAAIQGMFKVAIRSMLLGLNLPTSGRDVFVVAPTGMGKVTMTLLT